MKAYTCYIPNAVVVIFVNRAFSLFNVFFQSNNREINGKADTKKHMACSYSTSLRSSKYQSFAISFNPINWLLYLFFCT